MTPSTGHSPFGIHRVLDPVGEAVTLPQSALRLDPDPALAPDEVRVDVEVLNLDAASYRQLRQKHTGPTGHVHGHSIRSEVLAIIEDRGKMQNPVTGSGGMLIGTVAEVGPESPLGLQVGDRVATLVSLSLTPLAVHDRLERWDGHAERIPTRGHAILFGRSIAAVLPEDLDPELSLMIMDVCGAPATVRRVVQGYAVSGQRASVAVLGGAGKSGSLSLAAAREAGAGRVVAVVPFEHEARLLEGTGLADHVVLADARSPLGLAAGLEQVGGPVDVTIVCVDVPGCEQPALMITKQGGTVVYFSMATSFAAAALGAEGLAADVTMLIGNGYTPGHADYALSLLRDHAGVRGLFEGRLAIEHRAHVQDGGGVDGHVESTATRLERLASAGERG